MDRFQKTIFPNTRWPIGHSWDTSSLERISILLHKDIFNHALSAVETWSSGMPSTSNRQAEFLSLCESVRVVDPKKATQLYDLTMQLFEENPVLYERRVANLFLYYMAYATLRGAVNQSTPGIQNGYTMLGRCIRVIINDQRAVCGDVLDVLLVTPGLDINQRCWPNGRPPLCYLFETQDSDIVEQLVLTRPDLDLNAADGKGRTLFMHMCMQVRGVAASLWHTIAARADVDMNAQDHRGRTALMHGAMHPNTLMRDSLVIYLAKRTNPWLRDVHQRHILHYLAMYGNGEMDVKVLDVVLSLPAVAQHMNDVDINGNTCLMLLAVCITRMNTQFQVGDEADQHQMANLKMMYNAFLKFPKLLHAPNLHLIPHRYREQPWRDTL